MTCKRLTLWVAVETGVMDPGSLAFRKLRPVSGVARAK